MSTKIVGVVLRVKNIDRTAYFYRALGLQTHFHQHGGPLHFELGPIAHECIVEIYRRSGIYQTDALMISVSSIDAALRVAALFDIQPIRGLKETAEMKFIYITDPDGRAVMLMEETQSCSTPNADSDLFANQKCVPCRGNTLPLTHAEIAKNLTLVQGWNLVKNGIEKTFVFQNFEEALSFFNAVAAIAETEDHHPDMGIHNWKNVTLLFTTYAIAALTENDFVMAAKVDSLTR